MHLVACGTPKCGEAGANCGNTNAMYGDTDESSDNELPSICKESGFPDDLDYDCGDDTTLWGTLGSLGI